jgi:hypothetical protein
MVRDGNNMLYGDRMNKTIIKHFQSVNGVRDFIKDADWIPFPSLTVTDQAITEAASFVKQNKALGIDAIDSKHLEFYEHRRFRREQNNNNL